MQVTPLNLRAMKILLINNFHYRRGGSEAVYFNMADMLEQAGHEVIFFSCTDERNSTRGINRHFVEANSAVNPAIGAIRYIYNRKAAQALKALIAEQRPDIAHIHLLWGGLSSSIVKTLKQCNIPIVHTAHDYRMVCPAYTFRNGNGDICERCLDGKYIHCLTNRCSKGKLIQSALMSLESYFRRAIKAVEDIDGFVFVSNFSYEQHLRGIPALKNKQCIVTHNAIDIPLVNAEQGDYYLYFGRLSSEKGLLTLIDAFTTLTDLRLKIVGNGDMEEQLREAIHTPNIEMCGYMSGDSLRQIVAGAKAIIVPSEWYENNPMTIIEAAAMGTPAIGAHIGGIPEIILQGRTGYLFTPKSVEELATAVNAMESLSTEDYQAMRDECKAFAASAFNTDELYNKIIKLYNSLL